VVERPSFVQAIARSDEAETLIEWAQDSAFRFFPLIEHAELGLVLHPFDLATNKALALWLGENLVIGSLSLAMKWREILSEARASYNGRSPLNWARLLRTVMFVFIMKRLGAPFPVLLNTQWHERFGA
jgi:hypothetical protein